MGWIGIHYQGIGTGFFEFEGMGTQSALGDFIGNCAHQLGLAAGGRQTFFDTLQPHFAVIIILIKSGEFFAAQILDGPGGHIFAFVFIIRIGDKSIFQRFWGYPSPDPDISVGRDQRNVVFSKKILGGIHNGRSEKTANRKHIAFHFPQVCHGPGGIISIIL